MKEAIIVEGRKENFIPAECFVALDMNYCLDSTMLKGSFYRGKADQIKVNMAIYPNKEACENGGLNINEIIMYRDNVSENPKIKPHIDAIFEILKADIAKELGGTIEELTFVEEPKD
jgi:hypothetical protein